MIPYGKQFLDEEDINVVADVLKSDFLTTGPKINEFENKVAEYTGAKYAVAVSSGTAALHLACLAAGLKKGEELITSPMSFAASANCALYCRAKPIFVDIDEQGLIDVDKIEGKINDKTKVIIPVHYTGLPCNMEKIKQISDKHNLTIIEDACHALGAKYKGSKIGDCKYSNMAVFSFHPVKQITTGEGGMITTNSKELYEKLKMLRNHGITKDPKKLINKNEGPWHQEMQELGFNYRITDFQCALGISQLGKIEKFIENRRKIAKKYDKVFENNDNIEIIKEKEGQFDSYHLYVIRVKDKETRLKLFNYLKNNNIFCQVHYMPVYWHPYYQKLGYEKGLCSNAEEFYQRMISIPIYPKLTEKEQEYVIEQIKEFKEVNKNKKILSKRIYLRELTLDDASHKYCSWLNDPEVNKYLETHKSTIKELKKYIQKQIDDPNSFFVGIFDKKNDKHIGNIKLEPIDWKKRKVIFGILIGNKNYWGKSIGTEATKLIVDYAFNELNLTEIELGVISENKAAIRVYEKVGFKIVGIKKNAVDHEGVLYDDVIMVIKK